MILRSLFAASLVCVTVGQPLAAASAGVVAECKLAEAAYKAVQKSGSSPLNDILVGCPGYESWKAQMTSRQDSKAFRKAAFAKKPAAVKAAGKPGTLIFQRMIARGVPVKVAQEMTATKEFKNAVAQFGK
ncbi:hypothetical protein Q4544_06190 [Cognatishimia sp. 1_MG-2023]|uniref:hypothetical protein n=1 Tax=Cognatishimia sp. 1_MG-2023 TaxID=3062642 RepID=UPI0026E2A018|nr:hypothetical protein [Cognatishimia sp. 1_MG-2023]MDO6726516.1 hypothetical protein [Cognatishimia sp. 1_MG-2023]